MNDTICDNARTGNQENVKGSWEYLVCRRLQAVHAFLILDLAGLAT